MNQSDSIVIDTHALIWYTENNLRLSANAGRSFREIDQGILSGVIPTIVLAEIMSMSDKERTPLSFDEVIIRVRRSLNFEIVPLDLDTLNWMRNLTEFELHDRIIVAIAQSRGTRLITRDRHIRNSGLVECIW